MKKLVLKLAIAGTLLSGAVVGVASAAPNAAQGYRCHYENKSIPAYASTYSRFGDCAPTIKVRMTRGWVTLYFAYLSKAEGPMY